NKACASLTTNILEFFANAKKGNLNAVEAKTGKECTAGSTMFFFHTFTNEEQLDRCNIVEQLKRQKYTVENGWATAVSPYKYLEIGWNKELDGIEETGMHRCIHPSFPKVAT